MKKLILIITMGILVLSLLNCGHSQSDLESWIAVKYEKAMNTEINLLVGGTKLFTIEDVSLIKVKDNEYLGDVTISAILIKGGETITLKQSISVIWDGGDTYYLTEK